MFLSKAQQSYCYTKETFKKYARSRFPSFDPPLPLPSLFALVHFLAPLPPPQCTFVLCRTHPLPLNLYTCEIQRKEISNEYQYLWLNSTCLLSSHNGISIKWTSLVHDKDKIDCFIESPSKNQKSSKVSMKSTISHYYWIYWKDQKMERLKKLQRFFHSKVFKQGSLHQYT